MKNLNGALKAPRLRLGTREEVIAVAVLALLGVAGLSYSAITHVGTPAGAALAYMAAVDRADTDYVWTHSVIGTGQSSTASISLLDRSALVAQLKATAHSRTNLNFQGVQYVSGHTAVAVGYNTSIGHRTTNLVLQGGPPHSWPVLIEPAGLQLAVPSGVGTVFLDNQAIKLDGPQSKIALFPGLHKFTIGGPSTVFQPFEELFDVETTFPTLSSPSLADLRFTDSAAAEAKQAVAKGVEGCVGRTELKPSGCPQSYTSDIANGAATWTLIGDPTAGATPGFGPNGLTVSGHYLMKVSYASVARGSRTVAVGGPYTADLNWNGTGFVVSGFGDASSVPSLARPSATDPQILTALQAQFTTCLKLQAGSDPSCPQSVAAFYASNFAWRANSDPTQSANIVWNGAQGFFQVSGSFDFSVDYDSTPPYSPTRHYQDHSSGQYLADVYWDGSRAVFVGFEK